jgi:hypothetical protein
MKILWLDDLRNPYINLEGNVPKEDGIIEWVLNFEQFTQWITKFGLPDIISFDHDLADVDKNNEGIVAHYQEKTGMDCAKWLVNYCIDNNKKLPRFYVHSANPVGSKNIESLLNNFIKHAKNS